MGLALSNDVVLSAREEPVGVSLDRPADGGRLVLDLLVEHRATYLPKA
jgi:hypothetical protein